MRVVSCRFSDLFGMLHARFSLCDGSRVHDSLGCLVAFFFVRPELLLEQPALLLARPALLLVRPALLLMQPALLRVKTIFQNPFWLSPAKSPHKNFTMQFVSATVLSVLRCRASTFPSEVFDNECTVSLLQLRAEQKPGASTKQQSSEPGLAHLQANARTCEMYLDPHVQSTLAQGAAGTHSQLPDFNNVAGIIPLAKSTDGSIQCKLFVSHIATSKCGVISARWGDRLSDPNRQVMMDDFKTFCPGQLKHVKNLFSEFDYYCETFSPVTMFGATCSCIAGQHLSALPAQSETHVVSVHI